MPGKQTMARTVTEQEMANIIKKQQQLKQQQLLAAAASAGSTQAGTVQNLNQQVLAQAIQAGASTQVATLVKTVSSSGGKTIYDIIAYNMETT